MYNVYTRKPQQEEEEHVLNQYFSLGLVLKRKGVVCYFLLAAGKLKGKFAQLCEPSKNSCVGLIFFYAKNVTFTSQIKL